MLSGKSVLACLAMFGVCGVARAEFVYGQPIIIQNSPQRVSVHYFYATTPNDGVLWLAGSSSHDGMDAPLFFNHDGALGFEHVLGRYEIGDRLDFIYDVLTGAPDSFRTDDEAESLQFGWEWTDPDILLVGVEDTRLPGGDGDYDDMVFEIRFQSIPGPGAAALVGMGGILGLKRRRAQG